ncbi:hypothetical protein OX284_014320 [Flavobacterium sp. SUN046]|uniref:hypothetical protein n=1 Tax=Flavobacterium sp. SUN046 TaxID=3002440 RepID=UPI002DB997EE|nr:hypothetical protein [Flavobacterium sp. SUN046]MEC4050611.1 hypothetical protein [Flavobacterium sp. SUN046]
MDVLFVLFLFIFFVGGGYWTAKGIGEVLFGKSESKSSYIDKSVHHHTHIHEHKSINIIDDFTKKKVFELRDNNKKKTD